MTCTYKYIMLHIKKQALYLIVCEFTYWRSLYLESNCAVWTWIRSTVHVSTLWWSPLRLWEATRPTLCEWAHARWAPRQTAPCYDSFTRTQATPQMIFWVMIDERSVIGCATSVSAAQVSAEVCDWPWQLQTVVHCWAELSVQVCCIMSDGLWRWMETTWCELNLATCSACAFLSRIKALTKFLLMSVTYWLYVPGQTNRNQVQNPLLVHPTVQTQSIS